MAHIVFPVRLSKPCRGSRRTFSKVCTECDALSLLGRSRKRVRLDAQLQIEGRKNQHVHPAEWNVAS
jgi:hypothetical protein